MTRRNESVHSHIDTENKILYLVTGAAGFLGSTLCRQLTARGDAVRALVLPGDRSARYLPSQVEILEGDLLDKESLERFFTVPEGVSTILLHIASLISVNPDYSQKVMDINVTGTRSLIDLCLAHPECERMVYCSSTGAIPEAPKGQPIREVSFFDPDKVLGCYSQSKAMATQAVLDAVRDKGLNACVVHPTGIMGPEDNAVGETTGTLIRIIEGQMPAGIEGGFNLVDVRDLAAGTLLAAEKGQKGRCYILGNEEVSFRDFSAMVAREAGCKPMRFFLPIWAANWMADIMTLAAKRTGKKPLMTRFSVYNLARNNRFDSTRAKEELGYTTRSYEETIRDEVAYLIASGKIQAKRKAVAMAQPVHA